MAFFAATIDELQHDLLPAVESALLECGISTDKILINVGDDRLTKNEDIREFNRLDTPDSQKQFILLVNKGREGWNCRSLFGVALYRRPKSKIFVLQATMRCLRAIGEVQQTGQVYLSKENVAILDDELKENFRVTVQELETKGSTAQALQVHVRQPVEKVRVMRVRNLFQLVKKPLPAQIDLEMAYVQTDNYRMVHEMREGFSADSHVTRIEDISALRKRRIFSPYTLVAEIARYLNLPCLEIESLLTNSVSGMEAIVARVNEFSEILYDHIIPRLFNELYTIKEFTAEDPQEIELVRVPERGYYTVSAKPETTSLEQEHPAHAGKSFHLDAYSFDSNSEYQFFEKILPDSQVRKIFFTGMLTHGQSDFFVQYIDPESHTVRSYYPDFLIQDTQGQYFILEVKRDDQIDVPVVRAKKTFAEKTAAASNMKYILLKASDAEHGHYQMIWQPAARQRYLDEVIEESEQRDAQGES